MCYLIYYLRIIKYVILTLLLNALYLSSIVNHRFNIQYIN